MRIGGNSQPPFTGPPENTTRCIFHREKLGINKAFYAVCRGRASQAELKALPDLSLLLDKRFQLAALWRVAKERLVRKVDCKLEKAGESKFALQPHALAVLPHRLVCQRLTNSLPSQELLCSIASARGFSGQSMHLFLGRYLEESSRADITEDLKIHWSTQASPPGGEFHKVEAESKAPSRLGTRSTAQDPKPQACALAHTHVQHLLSLVPSAFMFLTFQEKKCSIFQKSMKCRTATPNFCQLHPSSVLDLHQILGGKKKALALSKVLHYKIYREMFTLK